MYWGLIEERLLRTGKLGCWSGREGVGSGWTGELGVLTGGGYGGGGRWGCEGGLKKKGKEMEGERAVPVGYKAKSASDVLGAHRGEITEDR